MANVDFECLMHSCTNMTSFSLLCLLYAWSHHGYFNRTEVRVSAMTEHCIYVYHVCSGLKTKYTSEQVYIFLIKSSLLCRWWWMLLLGRFLPSSTCYWCVWYSGSSSASWELTCLLASSTDASTPPQRSSSPWRWSTTGATAWPWRRPRRKHAGSTSRSTMTMLAKDTCPCFKS